MWVLTANADRGLPGQGHKDAVPSNVAVFEWPCAWGIAAMSARILEPSSSTLANARLRSPRLGLPAGVTPQTRAIEKARLTLGWMGVFHYTTESIVNRFLDIQARGLMPRLERQGMVKRVRVFSTRTSLLWVLTTDGLISAQACIAADICYPRHPERIAGQLMRHNLLVQLLLADRFRCCPDELETLRSARMLGEQELGDTVPDALYWERSGDESRLVYVEVELSYKPRTQIERKLQALAERLPGDAMVRWVFASEAMCDHYLGLWEGLKFRLDLYEFPEMDFEYSALLADAL